MLNFHYLHNFPDLFFMPSKILLKGLMRNTSFSLDVIPEKNPIQKTRMRKAIIIDIVENFRKMTSRASA